VAADAFELWWAGVGLAVTLAVLGALACWTTAEERERRAPGETPPPPTGSAPARPGAE
jgi:hypothetical protein